MGKEAYRPTGLKMNEVNNRARELTVFPTIATSLENAAFDASSIRQERMRYLGEALQNPAFRQTLEAVTIAKAFHEARIKNHEQAGQSEASEDSEATVLDMSSARPKAARTLFNRVAVGAMAAGLAACGVVGAESPNQAPQTSQIAVIQSPEIPRTGGTPIVETQSFAPQFAATTNANPVGYLDGSYDAWWNVVLDGWAGDTDAPTTSLNVHVYRDGQFLTEWGAVEPSPDVAAAAPQYPGNHRFHVVLPQSADDLIDHEFCVYAINIGGGDTNPLLGCTLVGNPEPTNIERLAQDRSWLALSDAEKAARVEREYVQIRRAVAIDMAGDGLAPNGDTVAHVMAEIPWFESRFGTHENSYNGKSGFIGLWQVAEVNSRDPMLVNPYYNLKVSESIERGQGLGAWPNTSRMVMNGEQSNHTFLSGNKARDLSKYGI
ncbi:hypothetical protein HYS00_01845 [Candidatus Microgenomates bacterium]|nr:hypothetical protein [Candidatus Microgenomates bacterium]